MSTVNGSQLRHAMNQAHMKENFEEEMIMNVRTQMADETYRRNSFKKYGISGLPAGNRNSVHSGLFRVSGTQERDHQRQSNGKDAGGSRSRGAGYL